MFVRFDCGCIGLVDVPGDAEGRPVVLDPCDTPSDCYDTPLSLYRRDMGDKGYEPLDAERTVELLTEMGQLMGEGYRYRQIKNLLR
jgi:hypothetical protein